MLKKPHQLASINFFMLHGLMGFTNLTDKKPDDCKQDIL